MNRLIEDLLDATRLEGGRLRLDCHRVATAQPVRESTEAQRQLAVAASLDLRVEVVPGVPCVWADRDRVLQVLDNLIGNAVKFTSRGGFVAVGAAARGSDVLFRVADCGAGIATDDQPHVFDRFWQGSARRERGAGLGLAIAKGLVEAHGGRMWLDSELGRGTTMFFTRFQPRRRPRKPRRSREAGGRRADGGGRRADGGGGRMAEVGGRMAEVGGRMGEAGGRMDPRP